MKKIDDMENKAVLPGEEGTQMVTVQLRPNRGYQGHKPGEVFEVDKATAERLVNMRYVNLVKDGEK